MMNELKARLAKLEELEQISTDAEKAYETEPENAELEATFDQAYKNEFAAYMACVKLVQKISGGRIDFQTAKKMVSTERGKLSEILDKYTLNSMCKNCLRLGKDCEGTTSKLWSGCIYKEVA